MSAQADPIETIANIIIVEAANRDCDDITRAIYDVTLSVRMKVWEMVKKIKKAEIAERLRKEVGGE